MAARQKYPLLNLRGSNYEVAEYREPGEWKRIITESVSKSFEIYKQTKAEKEVLKLAKLLCKADEMKK